MGGDTGTNGGRMREGLPDYLLPVQQDLGFDRQQGEPMVGIVREPTDADHEAIRRGTFERRTRWTWAVRVGWYQWERWGIVGSEIEYNSRMKADRDSTNLPREKRAPGAKFGVQAQLAFSHSLGLQDTLDEDTSKIGPLDGGVDFVLPDGTKGQVKTSIHANGRLALRNPHFEIRSKGVVFGVPIFEEGGDRITGARFVGYVPRKYFLLYSKPFRMFEGGDFQALRQEHLFPLEWCDMMWGDLPMDPSIDAKWERTTCR